MFEKVFQKSSCLRGEFFLSIIILAFLAFIFLIPHDTLAATSDSNTSKTEQAIQNIQDKNSEGIEVGVDIPGEGSSFKSFIDYMGSVFAFALKLGAALTTMMVVYAGYKYMTSQGNPSAIGEAKEIIIGSLSGFAMLLLVYLLLNIFNFNTP